MTTENTGHSDSAAELVSAGAVHIEVDPENPRNSIVYCGTHAKNGHVSLEMTDHSRKIRAAKEKKPKASQKYEALTEVKYGSEAGKKAGEKQLSGMNQYEDLHKSFDDNTKKTAKPSGKPEALSAASPNKMMTIGELNKPKKDLLDRMAELGAYLGVINLQITPTAAG